FAGTSRHAPARGAPAMPCCCGREESPQILSYQFPIQLIVPIPDDQITAASRGVVLAPVWLASRIACINRYDHHLSRVTRFPVVFRAHGCPLAPFDGRLATRILAEDAYFLAMKPVGRFLGCRHRAVQR